MRANSLTKRKLYLLAPYSVHPFAPNAAHYGPLAGARNLYQNRAVR